MFAADAFLWRTNDNPTPDPDTDDANTIHGVVWQVESDWHYELIAEYSAVRTEHHYRLVPYYAPSRYKRCDCTVVLDDTGETLTNCCTLRYAFSANNYWLREAKFDLQHYERVYKWAYQDIWKRDRMMDWWRVGYGAVVEVVSVQGVCGCTGFLVSLFVGSLDSTMHFILFFSGVLYFFEDLVAIPMYGKWTLEQFRSVNQGTGWTTALPWISLLSKLQPSTLFVTFSKLLGTIFLRW